MGQSMAYKRSNGKLQRRKIEPAVQTIILSTPVTGAGTTGSYYCDLSQIASIVNRRFYRQGINWMVSGMKFITAVDSSIIVRKLPNTWVMRNAWVKSFSAWQKMNENALAEAESVKPRFLDFKIFADKDHHLIGSGDNLLPVTYDLDQVPGAQIIPATPGEWEMSKFVVPKTDGTDGVNNFEIVAVGSNYPGSGASGLQAVSLIEGYAASRALPNVLDPNAPDDAFDADGPTPENWQSALFNEGTSQDDAVLTDMVNENNLAPYPFENDGIHTDTQYPGGANQMDQLEVHDLLTVSSTTIGGMTHSKGGQFPCGLIRFDHTTGDTAGNLVIQIDLVPGTHRGYLCEPMGA